MIEIGKKVPDFSLMSGTEKEIKLRDYLGKKVVIYFYPKDNTSGCTLEAENFRDYVKDFDELNTAILGISKDSVKSHIKFKNKLNLNFEILSDESKEICRAYDVLKWKKMFNNEYEGVVRSTFIIDEEGKLLKEYRNIKVPGHVKEVLDYIANSH
ncbi:MAG: thioredoxin-dependent thiol peroxidase [Clostridia bacterium]|nr:thioredoxin-dependent thiol peroxidase [Clostridia bacterium]